MSFENKNNDPANVSLDDMWVNLEKYFRLARVLEIGVGNSECPKVVADNAKYVERIDINENILELRDVQPSHIKHKVMDAKKLKYPDKTFDVILCINSYHELAAEIQGNVLREIYRTLKFRGYLIIIDPTESSITNKLFRVFNSNEDHAQRIRNSFKKLYSFIENNNMKIVLIGNTKFSEKFESKEKYLGTMLNWWNDVKIPNSPEEKKKMTEEITDILKSANMFDKLEISEDSQFLIIRKDELNNNIGNE